MTETPFDNVEGAHEYVSLLVEAVRQRHGSPVTPAFMELVVPSLANAAEAYWVGETS